MTTESSHTKTPTETEAQLMAVRRAKLEEIKAKVGDPFQANVNVSHTLQQAKEVFESAGQDQTLKVAVAGRIIAFRLMGKATFLQLLDQSGTLQIYVSNNEDTGIGSNAYELFKTYDIGDFIGVEGELFLTKTNALTVRAQKVTLVSKALRALPDKYHGLQNQDTIYRQRYLDLIVNQESRERFFKRFAILKGIREFLWERDFIEVETPMLQSVAGGAAARPFTTHFNALDRDFYLRISLELYLKRMLVGGYDRVFEIGRVFRNEGLSVRHNPEFTLLELYQAYSDYRGMMRLVYDLVQYLCTKVIKTTTIKNGAGYTLELGGQWKEITYDQCILEATKDADWFTHSKEEKLEACQRLGIEVNPDLEDFEVTNNVFEKCVAPKLMQPTFVTQLPKELCPLAKLNPKDPRYIDVFELYINGQEIAPAYSEQNDPDVQRKMFEWQAGEETQKIDEEFLEALEYGMPPAGGMGIGIDRLCILLTGADNIRDTLLYPTLK